MTARAIGAATRPPVTSLTPGWASTMTATATSGGLAGRPGEGDEPGVARRRVGAELGGAGLAADDEAGDPGRARRCRSSTTPIMASRIVAAASGDSGCCPRARRRASRTISPRSSVTRSRTWGAMITPSLATAAATSAICSGVADTSPWPIEARASGPLPWSSGNSVGNVEAAGGRQVERRSLVEAEPLGAGDHAVLADGLDAHRRRRRCCS